MKDLYYILGIAKTAGAAEIDAAYQTLSAKLKPAEGDNSGFLQNHFNEITDAYSILSNPGKRKAYDATLKRAHLKQLARFKAKTTNAFIAISILLIAGLLGFYLVNLINSHKSTKVDAKPETAAAMPALKKHHKHKKHTRALIARNRPKVTAPAKITPQPATAALATVVTANMAKQSINKIKPAEPAIAKPVTVAAIKPVIIKKDTARPKPVVAEAPIKHLILVKSTTQRDSSYVTYLKNNLRDSVYMHQLADYMSPVVSTLAANAKVKVLQKGRLFYKVALANGTGYVPKWALVKQ
ncbi:SH3 domain-containing protein [Mucilaginibacter ginkgonis]|uniref:DnaJ domain-containing protein n=1 Tax=Mucilaginibacter ginkgonis TaxID=2682091 RepID=A0A6I4I2R9_9SPHI|nr:SH3 domain-containing protein [Mucilaginibacter ginkgonis]QQL49580.1 DnaJ domain-containing protein [Mucilaginibacter ginkgonis]